jgi:hypothetical protein
MEITALRPPFSGMGSMQMCSSTGSTLFTSGGTLDVASGRPRFVVSMTLTNVSAGGLPIVASSGMMLAAANRDNPVLTDIRLTYRTTPSIGAIPPAVVPHSAIGGMGTGNANTLFMAIQLISDQAAERLNALSATDDPLSVQTTLTVGIEARGYLNSSRTPWTTGADSPLGGGALQFPIRITKSNTTCMNGYQADRCGQAGAWYNIDFSTPVTCCMNGECVFPPP